MENTEPRPKFADFFMKKYCKGLGFSVSSRIWPSSPFYTTKFFEGGQEGVSREGCFRFLEISVIFRNL